MSNRTYDLRRFDHKPGKKALSRDYSGAFFRWSCARRFVRSSDDVLDVGCGYDHPVLDVLLGGRYQHANSYTGVDLCSVMLKSEKSLAFLKEQFDFVERWRELLPRQYDVIVCFEVIEHMDVESGKELLKGCRELLNVNGTLLLSTPLYRGGKILFNHVHEYTRDEMFAALAEAGFDVRVRYGMMMQVIKLRQLRGHVFKALREFYDNDALSCVFAPAFPDDSKINIWVCK